MFISTVNAKLQNRMQLSLTLTKSCHIKCNHRRKFFYKKQHTHTRLTALFPGLPGWAGTRKVKPIWILLKQETVSGSGISWAVCKSAYRSRQITTPAPHHSVFLQAGCPSYHRTNSVKALKAQETTAKNLHVPETVWPVSTPFGRIMHTMSRKCMDIKNFSFKIQDGRRLPSWKSQNHYLMMMQVCRAHWLSVILNF